MESCRDSWTLPEGLVFLNHGSYGACPVPVLAAQSRFRAQLEHQPMEFMLKALEPLLDAARTQLGEFVGCDASDLAFVANATTGVNAVLRSLAFAPDDEILVTSHTYNACCNAAHYAAERSGARVVTAPMPFPLTDPEQIVAAIVAATTSRTKLALIDHVTSLSGLVLPLERIVEELAQREIEVLVDGAHAPGMVELDLQRLADLGVQYYAANLHKWVCAPKGAGFLFVRPDRQDRIRPTVISHGANTVRPGRSRYRLEFDWVGTVDPSPYLSVPNALCFLGGLLPDGWPALRARNRNLALRGREIVGDAIGASVAAPESMIGSIAAILLPGQDSSGDGSWRPTHPLQETLLHEHGIQSLIGTFPGDLQRILRISAAAYNREQDYVDLAAALQRVLAR